MSPIKVKVSLMFKRAGVIALCLFVAGCGGQMVVTTVPSDDAIQQFQDVIQNCLEAHYDPLIDDQVTIVKKLVEALTGGNVSQECRDEIEGRFETWTQRAHVSDDAKAVIIEYLKSVGK